MANTTFQIHVGNNFRKRPKANIAISKLVGEIKTGSCNWINKSRFVKERFQWQNGFGAFTYSHSHLTGVYNYILNQEKHHQKKSFKDEYEDLLRKYEVNFNPEYLVG
nr:transposase [Luteibaculum oceani]